MYTFRKDERLCNKKIIGDLYASDNRLLVYPLSVHWLITEQKHPCRLQVLIVAPKKKLHHAVDRNRTKRLMRECYRHRKHLLLETLEQKNLSMAGVTIVIVKDDALGKAPREIPTMLDYRTHVSKGSMFNTPPVVPIYCALENLRWVKKQGGVEAMDKLAKQRAEIVYGEIDRNKLFVGTAKEEDRSLMNLCFVMAPEYKELEKEFLDFAVSKGMVGVKGHRDVGGFRASCYNAQTIEGCNALVACMKEFEANH